MAACQALYKWLIKKWNVIRHGLPAILWISLRWIVDIVWLHSNYPETIHHAASLTSKQHDLLIWLQEVRIKNAMNVYGNIHCHSSRVVDKNSNKKKSEKNHSYSYLCLIFICKRRQWTVTGKLMHDAETQRERSNLNGDWNFKEIKSYKKQNLEWFVWFSIKILFMKSEDILSRFSFMLFFPHHPVVSIETRR